MSRILPTDSPDSDPPGVHEISVRKGWEMIRRHRDLAVERSITRESPEWDSMRFHKAAILRLLGQKGAKVFTVHKAVYPDGTETLVLSAADKNGKELKGGGIVMMNAGTPCPPDCPNDPPD